jgi:protein TonB
MDALTFKDNLTEETVVEQQNEETKYVTPPYQEEVPPSYNPETPPPGYYNETPPAYNNETPPYNPWGQPYDEESPSFFQKYWKYGLLALIPLLILGGVLLFSGSKDDEETRDHDVVAANMEEDGKVADDVEETASEVTDEDQKDAGDAAKEAEEKAREAQEKAKEAAKKAAEDAKTTTPAEPTKPVVEEKKPEPPKPVEDNNVYSVVESSPSFPGGNAAMRQWMSQNLKYPPVAQENGIQGTVTVQFVVEKNGSISNVKVIRGKDPSLDREAVRVVSSMPRWTPGKQNGKPVRVSYTVPVKFALQ